MREEYHHATAEAIREGLLDAVSMQDEAERVADTVAESLSNWFGMPDREIDDVAEVLAHAGIGPDDIQDMMWEGLRKLAARTAAKLVTQPPDRDRMPAAAYSAMVRLRVRARRSAAAHFYTYREDGHRHWFNATTLDEATQEARDGDHTLLGQTVDIYANRPGNEVVATTVDVLG